MNIEQEFSLMKEWLNIYIDLLPYFINQKWGKYELPTFDQFKKEYQRFTKPTLQCTIIHLKGRVQNSFSGGIVDLEKTNYNDWLYYYRYSEFKGFRYNIQPTINNPHFKLPTNKEGLIIYKL